MRGKRDRRQLDEDVDVSTLAPLVDLVETNMADLVEVELGESISTNDPVIKNTRFKASIDYLYYNV